MNAQIYLRKIFLQEQDAEFWERDKGNRRHSCDMHYVFNRVNECLH